MNTNNTTLRLRPHHLLCLQSFAGHGYSEQFIQQMTLVKKQLTLSPGTPVELVCGPDLLCSHCPNCREGHCTSGKPALFDQLVIRKFPASSSIPSKYSSALSDLSGEPAVIGLLCGIPEFLTLSPSLLADCCPECEWRALCEEIIS